MSEMRRGRRERFFLQKPPSHSVPFSRSVLEAGSERVNSATAVHTPYLWALENLSAGICPREVRVTTSPSAF